MTAKRLQEARGLTLWACHCYLAVLNTNRPYGLPAAFWGIRLRGLEQPDIPRLLGQLEKRGCTIDLADVTYFVGHETVTTAEKASSPVNAATPIEIRENAVEIIFASLGEP